MTNVEIQMTKEVRSTNDEITVNVSCFDLRHSFDIRHSTFVTQY